MEKISPLNCPMITPTQMGRLKENQIITLMDFISAPKELVLTSMEISVTEYKKFRQSVLLHIQPCPVSLCQFAEAEKVTPKSTGILSLDKLLRGGLFPGDLIELYGKTGSGKTQLCLYLASQAARWRGGNSSVIYFDLKNDFYSKRLLDLCGGDDTALDNVMIFRVANLKRLMAKLEDIKLEYIGGLNGFYSRCELLVLDSVPMVIYPAVQADQYSWRYYQERLLEKLEWLANHMNLTVILVNHAVTPRTLKNSDAPTVKAALGIYWQHKIKLRIQLSGPTVLSNSSAYYSGFLEKCSRGPSRGTFNFCLKADTIKDVSVKPGEKEKFN